MTHPFYRLAPFIQEYIYRAGWGELRPVQVQAVAALLDTPTHVLITSGTASGKTEAAFLPILTSLIEQPPDSIGVIYIGPLKALINDQFYRLEGLLAESDIPVQSWHGDVSASKKQRFLRQARGVLQITPESLESLLINRSAELGRLFGELRFVVIDEVHALINSDRGRQVLCQLQRLARYQQHPARRVGLSATLGEPELAMQWLKGGTDRAVSHIDDQHSKREIMLGVEYFTLSTTPDAQASDRADHEPSADKQEADHDSQKNKWLLYQHMYTMVRQARKTLVFANRRREVEEIIYHLSTLAAQAGDNAIAYYTHHGSIATALREQAEQDMRDPATLTCVAATITLELGIDLGSLDQVLQLNATNSVSSFVQRLGRSGRRGSAAKLFLYSTHQEQLPNASLGQRIPWDLLQTIAIIQLYLEERWIEPPSIPRLPFNLLYHQTMSILVTHTELTAPELAEHVLTLTPFQHITLDQYRTFLRHLRDTEHIAQVEGGGIIIGLAGEQVVNSYRFYGVFPDDISYTVSTGAQQLGTIQALPQVGDRIGLAGRAWIVESIDEGRKAIQVRQVKGSAPKYWSGGGVSIHTRILQRMRHVLAEQREYGYLQPQALRELHRTRQLAHDSGMLRQAILPLSDTKYMLLPWCGTRVGNTVVRLFQHAGIGTSQADSDVPYYLEVKAADAQTLIAQIQHILEHPPDPVALAELVNVQAQRQNKYDRYVPDELIRAAYAVDQIDLAGALDALRGMVAMPGGRSHLSR
ncbi:DEAD/DEAH box helicase [bacterium]|nr:DEAD/DEAH box helicase [bacterium]